VWCWFNSGHIERFYAVDFSASIAEFPQVNEIHLVELYALESRIGNGTLDDVSATAVSLISSAIRLLRVSTHLNCNNPKTTIADASLRTTKVTAWETWIRL